MVCSGEPFLELDRILPGDPEFRFAHGRKTSNCAITSAPSGLPVGYWWGLYTNASGVSFVDLWRRVIAGRFTGAAAALAATGLGAVVVMADRRAVDTVLASGGDH